MSEARDIMGAVVTHVPVLLARIGSSTIRLLFGSRRAAWTFKRSLRQGGMSRRRARQLAGQYRRQVDVLRIVRRFLLKEKPWRQGQRRQDEDHWESEIEQKVEGKVQKMIEKRLADEEFEVDLE